MPTFNFECLSSDRSIIETLTHSGIAGVEGVLTDESSRTFLTTLIEQLKSFTSVPPRQSNFFSVNSILLHVVPYKIRPNISRA